MKLNEREAERYLVCLAEEFDDASQKEEEAKKSKEKADADYQRGRRKEARDILWGFLSFTDEIPLFARRESPDGPSYRVVARDGRGVVQRIPEDPSVMDAAPGADARDDRISMTLILHKLRSEDIGAVKKEMADEYGVYPKKTMQLYSLLEEKGLIGGQGDGSEQAGTEKAADGDDAPDAPGADAQEPAGAEEPAAMGAPEASGPAEEHGGDRDAGKADAEPPAEEPAPAVPPRKQPRAGKSAERQQAESRYDEMLQDLSEDN